MCLSFTLLFSSHFYLYSVLNLFFHEDNAKANIPCVSANRGSLVGPAEMYSDNRGVVQSLGNDEVHRIVVGYKDVDLVISIGRWCMSLLKK